MSFIIKHSRKSLKNAHVIPVRRRRVIVVGDSLEPVIINNMVLWGDVSSFEIPNEADGVCVDWRAAWVLTSARAWAPSGYLAPC